MKPQLIFSAIILCFLSIHNGFSAEELAEHGYLTALEAEVVRELNLARANPQLYADYLREMSQFFNGNRLEMPGEISLITKEGRSAVQEAINFLLSSPSLRALEPSRGLSLAAKDHVSDQRAGAMGHTGSDGSKPPARMARYGAWQRKVAENIAYGGSTARSVILQLIVDDGVPDRGHRANIFDPEYRVVGVGCGPHARYAMMCVMDFAAGYAE